MAAVCLHVHVLTQGEATTERIDVDVRAAPGCAPPAAVRLRILVGGRPAAVAGNGRLVPVRGGHALADWSNWCGRRAAVEVVAAAAGVKAAAPARPLPACVDRRRGSRLGPIP